MLHKIKRGTASKLITVFVFDKSAATPTGLDGLTAGTAGLVCRYKRSSDSTTTTVTLTGGTLGTWTSGKFQAVTGVPGLYEFGVPNAAFASGDYVDIYFGGAANMWCPVIKIELDAFDYQDQIRGGLAALPAVAAGSAGGALVAAGAANQVNVVGGLVAAKTEATAATLTYNLTGAVSGSVGSVVGGVKLAADGLDAIAVTDPGAPTNANTLPKMIVALWRSFYRKKTLGGGTLKHYADDGTTVTATQVYADDGTTQTVGSAS